MNGSISTYYFLNIFFQTWSTYKRLWLKCIPMLIAQGTVIFLLCHSNHFLGPLNVSGQFSFPETMRFACFVLIIYFTVMLIAQIYTPEKTLTEISHSTGKQLFHSVFTSLLMIFTAALIPLLIWAILFSPGWEDIWQNLAFTLQRDVPWWQVFFSYLALIAIVLFCLWPAVGSIFSPALSCLYPINGMQALAMSFKITWGHWWRVFSTVCLTTAALSIYLTLLIRKFEIILGLENHYSYLGAFIVNQLVVMPWFLCAQVVNLKALTHNNEIQLIPLE